MQKWHFYSTIGKGRPLTSSIHHQCVLTLPRHHFHTSSPHRKAGGPDKVMEEVAKPSPNRAKRLQDASNAVQDLYLRHAGKDNSTTGHRNTGFESVPLKGTSDDQPAVIDARNMGVPFSKDVIEGRAFGTPGVDQREKFRQDRQDFARTGGAGAGAGAVDARSLGARPEGGTERGRFSMGRVGVVDARNLGARPAETVGLSQKQRLPTRSPRNGKQTVGLAQKQRFPTRAPRDEYEQEDDPQSRQPRREYNGIQERAPRLTNDFRARTPRSDFQRAPRGGRPPRPRDSEDGESSRQRRGAGAGRGGGDSSSGIHVNIWNEEELEYFKEKKDREAPQATDYNPNQVSLQGLIDYSPAIVSGTMGISQILEERLALAKKCLAGEFIQWDSKEQKADVLTLVESLKAAKRTKQGQDEGKEGGSKTDPRTNALLGKIWSGKYELARPMKEKDVLGHVARLTDRNESYFPDDEKSLVEKVRSILPAEAVRGGRQQGAKQARK